LTSVKADKWHFTCETFRQDGCLILPKLNLSWVRRLYGQSRHTDAVPADPYNLNKAFWFAGRKYKRLAILGCVSNCG
jgi:hypothetical protein